jgi:hypothetical protein
MNAAEFERAFRELLRSQQSSDDNTGCVSIENCIRCRDCTFCKGSIDLLRCHYCFDSERCVDCTHCRLSQDLFGCTHMTGCSRCSRSAYLERCVDCRDCNYCFGCVGLSGRDFHILNEPYDRSAYFKLTAELSRSLGAAPTGLGGRLARPRAGR